MIAVQIYKDIKDKNFYKDWTKRNLKKFNILTNNAKKISNEKIKILYDN